MNAHGLGMNAHGHRMNAHALLLQMRDAVNTTKEAQEQLSSSLTMAEAVVALREVKVREALRDMAKVSVSVPTWMCTTSCIHI
jgi:hypothetical protein